MFGRRPDATLVKDAAVVRRFMPFISPRRNESLVYYAQEVLVDDALAFVDRVNQHRPADRPATLFHLILYAIAQGIHERPRINRFTKGGRLWQRKGLFITFSAKMRIADDAPLITVKREVDPTLPFETMLDGMLDSLQRGRSGKKSASDHEMAWLLRAPAPITFAILKLVDWIDAAGLLPKGMIDGDPMYSSIFVANLGSVNLGAGYHHLWDHGTCPMFAVIGRIATGADGRRRVTIKYSYDERIEDGLYAMGALERIREILESPDKLG